MTICQAENCGKPLRGDNRSGFCRTHSQSITARGPERICAADGCDRTLRVTNKSGYCARHPEETPNVKARNEMLRAQREEHRKARPECSYQGCTNGLRSDNKTGRCRTHTNTAVRAECSYDGCTNLLTAKNETGRCEGHKAIYWIAPLCGFDGCDKILHADNETGRCQKHRSEYRRDYMLWRLYGLTVEQHDAMLAAQKGVCALCGQPPKPGGVRAASRLHVDHDHATKRVRALLCNHCNHGLGCFDDNPAALRRAADYIEHYRALPQT